MADAKEKAMELFEVMALKYANGIDEGVLTKNMLPAVLKELFGLATDVKKVEGEPINDKVLTNLIEVWSFIKERDGITDKDIENAELKFETATGRKTAMPIFATRFEA